VHELWTCCLASRHSVACKLIHVLQTAAYYGRYHDAVSKRLGQLQISCTHTLLTLILALQVHMHMQIDCGSLIMAYRGSLHTIDFLLPLCADTSCFSEAPCTFALWFGYLRHPLVSESLL
jgi:hypothetical protein